MDEVAHRWLWMTVACLLRNPRPAIALPDVTEFLTGAGVITSTEICARCQCCALTYECDIHSGSGSSTLVGVCLIVTPTYRIHVKRTHLRERLASAKDLGNIQQAPALSDSAVVIACALIRSELAPCIPDRRIGVAAYIATVALAIRLVVFVVGTVSLSLGATLRISILVAVHVGTCRKGAIVRWRSLLFNINKLGGAKEFRDRFGQIILGGCSKGRRDGKGSQESKVHGVLYLAIRVQGWIL